MTCRSISNIVSSLVHLRNPEGQDVSDLCHELTLGRRGVEKWLKNTGCMDKTLKFVDRFFLLTAVATRESGKADAASKLFAVRDATATARAITGIAKAAQGCIPDAIRALRNLGHIISKLWNNADEVGLRTKKSEWNERERCWTNLSSLCLSDTCVGDVGSRGVARYSSKNNFRCKLVLVGFKQFFTLVDKTCFSVAFLVFNPISVAGRFCGDAMSYSLRFSSKQGMTILMATCQSSALIFCFLDIGDAVLYGDGWTGFNNASGKVTVLGTIWDHSGKITVKSLQLSMSIISLGKIPVGHPLILPTIHLVAAVVDLCDTVIKFNPNNPDYGDAAAFSALQQKRTNKREQAAINGESDSSD